MTERTARMALCALGQIGSLALSQLVVREGAEEVWQSLKRQSSESTWSRRAQAIDETELERATYDCGARFIIPGDEEWPTALTELDSVAVGGQGGSPYGLWVRGGRLDSLERSVAIVGSRAASHYGQECALELSADLASAGHPVVSGLAYGIDAAAHRGALAAGGATIGVMASGIDRPYPASNTNLAAMIVRRGTLVSEMPPGSHPLKAAFLARNRIIAAMVAGIILVEAAIRSGAKNTVTWGSALQRVVMAVPGPVTSSLSQTPHRLIREGEASLVTDLRDIQELLCPLGTVPEAIARGEDRPIDRLPEDAKMLREVINVDEELDLRNFMQRTGLSRTQCLAGIHDLVETGWLEVGLEGWRLPRAHRISP